MCLCSFVTESLQEIDLFINNCELSRLMQELIGNYIMMEEYFMREMVVKVNSVFIYVAITIFTTVACWNLTKSLKT